MIAPFRSMHGSWMPHAASPARAMRHAAPGRAQIRPRPRAAGEWTSDGAQDVIQTRRRSDAASMAPTPTTTGARTDGCAVAGAARFVGVQRVPTRRPDAAGARNPDRLLPRPRRRAPGQASDTPPAGRRDRHRRPRAHVKRATRPAHNARRRRVARDPRRAWRSTSPRRRCIAVAERSRNPAQRYGIGRAARSGVAGAAPERATPQDAP